MAELKKLIPFILKWEGGLSNDAVDTASRNICPTPYKGKKGYHTNKGITYATWTSMYGRGNDIRFLEMSNADWEAVIRKLYWDRWQGDKITGQAAANTLVDWVWGSGAHGIKMPQRMLGVTADGVVGAKTIEALNEAGESFLPKLYAEREKFLRGIAARNPSQSRFLKGWLNRMNDLKKHNQK